jgi:hypothetical protein
MAEAERCVIRASNRSGRSSTRFEAAGPVPAPYERRHPEDSIRAETKREHC